MYEVCYEDGCSSTLPALELSLRKTAYTLQALALCSPCIIKPISPMQYAGPTLLTLSHFATKVWPPLCMP